MTQQTKTLAIKAIRIDGGTQSRAELCNETVSNYKEALEDGAEFPPVVVFHDGADHWLADGFHRYFAYTQAGRASIKANVHQGTSRDAILYAVGSNGQHGKPRSNADKRKAVTTLLADVEWAKWSDHEIARRCCVSQPFVGSVRSSLITVISENGQPDADAGKPEVRKRIDKHGNESEVKVGNIGHKSGGTPAGEASPNETGKPAAQPPARRTAPPAGSAAQSSEASADAIAEAAHGDTDIVTLLEQTQRELEQAQAVIASAEADDLKAEAMKWRRIADVHQRRQGELMDSVNVRERELTRLKSILDRIGRAVGESDPAKMASAVERAMRAAKVSA